MRDWLTARPFAHRGLHDAAAGVIENTASAFRAAVDAGYGIECDLQISADGEAMVHHDDALGRLNDGTARLDTMTAGALRQVPFKATTDRIIALGELCDLVAGRVPLLIELKGFQRDTRLAERTTAVLAAYRGAAAVMSFDPGLMATVRQLAPALARGLVGMRREPSAPTARMSTAQYIPQAIAARPQFLAYRVQDLTQLAPMAARTIFRLPLLTWTVKTPADRARAVRHADQMIFEGFRP
jgi:glycerophosphoryl diester phosphodiesterase